MRNRGSQRYVPEEEISTETDEVTYEYQSIEICDRGGLVLLNA